MDTTDLEIKMIYYSNYDYFMCLLEIAMLKHPEKYHLFAEFGEEYRANVRRVAQIDDLPPVPKP